MEIREQWNENQAAIRDACMRYRDTDVCAGRKFGKSWEEVRTARKWINEWRPGDYCIAAPSHKYHKNIVIPEIYKAIPVQMLEGQSWERAFNKNDNIIKFHTVIGKSSLYLASMEHGSADAYRGMSFDGVVFEEFSYIRRYAWEEVMKPTLSAKSAKTLKTFTPNGLNHAYQEFIRDAPDHKSFHFTSYDGPLPKEEVDRLADSLPEIVRRQEIYAEFIEDLGGVFRGVDEITTGDLADPVKGRQYAFGVDLAKHKDFNVVYGIDREEKHLSFRDRFHQLDWGIQKAMIKAAVERYNNATFLMDSTGIGDPIFDDFVNMGLKVKGYFFTNESKRKLIENLAVKIQNKEFTIPDIPELISELKMFQAESLPSGRIRYNAPEGYHDDCVIALALAVWELGGVDFGKGALTADYKRERPKLRI